MKLRARKVFILEISFVIASRQKGRLIRRHLASSKPICCSTHGLGFGPWVIFIRVYPFNNKLKKFRFRMNNMTYDKKLHITNLEVA